MNTILMFFFGPAGSFWKRLQGWGFFNGNPDDTLESLLNRHLFCNDTP